MKKIIKAVLMFVTKGDISRDFNPWLIQTELDVIKRF